MSQINAIAASFRANGCQVIEDLNAQNMILVLTRSGRLKLISPDENPSWPVAIVKYPDQCERIAQEDSFRKN